MLNKYYRFAVEKDDPSEAPESGDKPDSQPQKIVIYLDIPDVFTSGENNRFVSTWLRTVNILHEVTIYKREGTWSLMHSFSETPVCLYRLFSYYFPRDYDWLSQLPGGTGRFMAKNA